MIRILLLSALWISQTLALASSNATGFSMKLTPRDMLESPGNLTRAERIERLFEISRERATYLAERVLSGDHVAAPKDISTVLAHIGWYYTAEMSLGTPGTVVHLIMDTGSGALWTQCKPCYRCFPQTSTIFDSRASSSYRKLPCSHALCRGPQATFRCVMNECVYNKIYGGGSQTRGVAAMESMRFPFGTGTRTINDLIFGCSNDNINFGEVSGDKVSGIMGMSMSSDSILTQLGPLINRRFSYCLHPLLAENQRTSLLSFGTAIPVPRGRVQRSPFFKPSGPASTPHYFLSLIDISVGSQPLKFPPRTFFPREGFTNAFLLDTGAPLTTLLDLLLPGRRNVFQEVLGAFQQRYDSMRLSRKSGPGVQGDLCYIKPAGFQGYVPMTYHLQGGDYTVEGKFTIIDYTDHFCLAITRSRAAFNILGAAHQQNMRIIFDMNTNPGTMQFVPEACH